MIGRLVLVSLLLGIIQTCCPEDQLTISCPVSHENCRCSQDSQLKIQRVSCWDLTSFPEFAGNEAEWTTVIENSSVRQIFPNTFTFLRRKALIIRNNPDLRAIHNFAFSWSKLDSLVVELNPNLIEIESLAFNNLLPSSSPDVPCKLDQPHEILRCSPQLRLSQVGTFSVDDTTFARAPHLRFVEMSSIRELVVKPGGLTPLINLQGLMISRVESIEFDSSLLDHLSFLQFLTLSHLPITELPQQLFIDTSELAFIFLDHNNLGWLEGGEMKEMTQLRLLRLDNNNLSFVPDWLLHLPAKVGINVGSNPIVCNCSLHVIKEIPKLKVTRIRGLPSCVATIVKMEFCDNQMVSAMFSSALSTNRRQSNLDGFLLIFITFLHFCRTVSH